MTEAQRPVTIIAFTGGSGITHYAMSLGQALSAHCPVSLLTGRNYDEQGYPPMPYPVLPFFHRSRYYFFDLARLAWHLLKRREQLVLLQSVLKIPVIDAMFFRLLKLCGVRCVMTVHDVLPHYPGCFSRIGYRYLYSSFSALVVHSERARDAVRALGVDVPSHVIPHGLYDLFNFDGLSRQQARKSYSKFDSNDFVLLFFGRIGKRKGIADFLDLMDGLAGQPQFRFVIAGSNGIDPADQALLRRFEAARQNPRCLMRDDNVPFAEVQRYFRMADAVVLPYREGTTSGVLKLALAFGLPVVASDVGDLGESLIDGIGVLISDEFTDCQLRDAVLRLHANAKSFAQNCIEVQQKYKWSRIANRYVQVLQGTLKVSAE